MEENQSLPILRGPGHSDQSDTWIIETLSLYINLVNYKLIF